MSALTGLLSSVSGKGRAEAGKGLPSRANRPGRRKRLAAQIIEKHADRMITPRRPPAAPRHRGSLAHEMLLDKKLSRQAIEHGPPGADSAPGVRRDWAR